MPPAGAFGSSQQPGAGNMFRSDDSLKAGGRSLCRGPRVNRSSSGPDRNIPKSVPKWHVATQYFFSAIVTPYNPSLRFAGP